MCRKGHNQLTELPAAINELKNLKELNVSNNKIVRPFSLSETLYSPVGVENTPTRHPRPGSPRAIHIREYPTRTFA